MKNDESNFNPARFARWLRESRANAKPYLSMTALADKVGISKQRISQLEGGDKALQSEPPSQPALNIVEAIAVELHTDINNARIAAGYEPLPVEGMREDLKILFHDAEKWSDRKWSAVIEAIKKDIDFINTVLPDEE